MEEKEMRQFSWTGLFLVTGLCFFAFSFILKFLDNSHPRKFLWIGGICLFLGLLNAVTTFVTNTSGKDRRKLSS